LPLADVSLKRECLLLRRPGVRVPSVFLIVVFGLSGCISYTAGPTVVLPPGATVVCANGQPAVLANGAYHCY